MFALRTNTHTLSPSTNFFGGDSSDFIQPKLEVGKPGDRYEVEADKAADQIVARESQTSTSFFTPASTIQTQTDEDIQKQETANEVQQKPVVDSITPGVQLKPIIQQQTQEEIQKKEEEEEEIQMKCSKCSEEDIVQKKSADQQQTSNSIENQLQSSKGGGNPMSEETRSSMESGFGTDFSNVRIHTDSNAVQMNKNLGAQAFANGNDIYFNQGKYNPESTTGKHLLAHELTHTIQQGGSAGVAQNKIQMLPNWMNSAANWVGDKASGVAESVSDGAAFIGDKVVAGANWVGDKVASGAEWVGDQISEAGSFVMDGLKGAINSGTNFLNEKWNAVKDFGSSAFEQIKQSLGELAGSVTSPLTMMFSSLSNMSADLLEGAWNTLKSGGTTLWNGINAVIQVVLQKGETLWSTISGFVDGIFSKINGFFSNTAFNLLPDVIKNGIRSTFNGLKSLWKNVSSFWKDLWSKLTSYGQEILMAVEGFIEKVMGYGIAQVISIVRDLKEVYDYVVEAFKDPKATIMPYLESLANKLGIEGPQKSKEIGTKVAKENQQDSGSNATTIQRVPIDGKERDTSSLEEVLRSIWFYLKETWDGLDILNMLWDALRVAFYPPETIKAIEEEFELLFYDDWKEAENALYTPRSFSEDPLACMHDLWSNFLILLDYPLALLRRINNSVALLMGYVTVLSVIIGAVVGAGAGALFGYGGGAAPGLIAGASAGLGAASSVGGGLMTSFITLELSIAALNFIRVFTANQTCAKRQIDIISAVASAAGAATAGILNVLMSVFSRVATMVVRVFRTLAGSKTVKNAAGAATSDVLNRITGRQATKVKPPSKPSGNKTPANKDVNSGKTLDKPKETVGEAKVKEKVAEPVPVARKMEVGAKNTLQKKDEETTTDKKEQRTLIQAGGRRASAHLGLCDVPSTDNSGPDNENDPKEEEERELPPTVVKHDWDSENERPSSVKAEPLTHIPGTDENSQGSKPKKGQDPAGWGLVRIFKYYDVFTNTEKEEGTGREVRLVEDTKENIVSGHPDYEKTRSYAVKKGFSISENTEWERFHMLHKDMHGPGIRSNLLSASNSDNKRYRSFENKVNKEVNSEMENPLFFEIKASYRNNDKISDKIDESFKDEDVRENIKTWYGQLPETLELIAGDMEYNEDKNEYEIPKGVTPRLHDKQDFPFNETIDISLPKHVRPTILVISGRRKFPKNPKIATYLSSQIETTDIETFVNNFSSVFPSSKTDTHIGYLKKIVTAITTPEDNEIVTLFEGGKPDLEVEKLEEHIKSLEEKFKQEEEERLEGEQYRKDCVSEIIGEIKRLVEVELKRTPRNSDVTEGTGIKNNIAAYFNKRLAVGINKVKEVKIEFQKYLVTHNLTEKSKEVCQ